jgi:Flp pilus assembly protein TadD
VIRHIFVASCAYAAVVASPATVTGQQRVFAQGLSEFTRAAAGTYGDEGTRIGPALDKMANGLAEWDRAIQALEGRRASESAGASPPVILEMHVALARMYVERGRLADAVRELDATSRLEPQHTDLHMLRGLALEASNRSTEAGEAFRTAWVNDASDPIKAYHVFHTASRTGNSEDAARAREALDLAYRRLLRDTLRVKASPFVDLQPLHDIAADTLVLTPAAYARGYADLAHGDYEDAIAQFRKAATTDPLVVDPATRSRSMVKAVAALREGRPAEARALLEASAAVPGSSEAHRVLGMIYWADSQDDKSIEQLEIAIRENPRDERARLVLARVLTSAGRDSDARRVLQETIQDLPDSALAHWWLGSNLERLNQFSDARREFELATAGAVAGQSQLHASIGRLAAEAADFSGASEAFARAVREHPNDSTLRMYLASALLQQDRAGESFAELVAALLIDPSDSGAHAGIGQIYLNAGRYDEAVLALRRAVALSADHTEARYALATALMRLGNTEEAAREFERVEQAQRQTLAARRREMTLDVMKEEAALRTAEGNYDRAIEQLEAAAKLQSRDSAARTDPEIYRRLAELYAKVGRVEDAARATSMYTRARQGIPAGDAPR